MATTFYSEMFTKLDATLSTYIGSTVGKVIGAIEPVALTMLTIYVMLWGLTMIRGSITEPVLDGVSRMVRLAIIVGIALNIGYYNDFLADWLWKTPDALAAVISDTQTAGSAAGAYLDTTFDKVWKLGEKFYEKAVAEADPFVGIPDFMFMGTAMIIWVAGSVLTAYGAFLLALSKLMLAVLLGVGVIFVLLLIFEPTKRFFDSWLAQVLNAVFTVVLSAAAIGLIFSIIEAYVTAASAVDSDTLNLHTAWPAIIFCVIGVLALIQVPSVASSLGGGVSVGSLGAVAWTYRKGAGAGSKSMSSMRPTNIKRGLRTVGREVNAVKSMANAPMAAYRKITGGSKKNSVGKI